MTEPQSFERDQYLVSTDKGLLQLDRIHTFLSRRAYWSLNIPFHTIETAIKNSICFGVFVKRQSQEIEQIGFARIVTDYATFGWICDVYIEEPHRRKGLSKWLMDCVKKHEVLAGLRRICLTTKNAHGLYIKSGFEVTKTPGSWMEIKNNDIYRLHEAIAK